jgi:diacylglycerol kinase
MKLIKSFGYAINGLLSATKDQLNLRIHFVVALGVIGAGIYFRITSLEWTVCLLAISLVISLELVNTAIESLTDLVTLERNPLAGKVKDIAAASVMISSFVAVAIGLIIFLKYIF